MPVTYKPTNIFNPPFIRYSGTSAYSGDLDKDTQVEDADEKLEMNGEKRMIGM